jgi:hypothetical protein
MGFEFQIFDETPIKKGEKRLKSKKLIVPITKIKKVRNIRL